MRNYESLGRPSVGNIRQAVGTTVRATMQNRFGPALPASDLRWLLVAALILWVAAYGTFNLGLLTDPIQYQTERVLRRIVTSGAGFLLCLAMLPALWRASAKPLTERVLMAFAVSAFAHLTHLLVRLSVFHLYRPLWGPLDWEVVFSGVQGAGWMFVVWAVLCLLVFREARSRCPEEAQPEPGTEAISTLWSDVAQWRVRIPVETVFLFEAERDYVRLHTPSRQYLVRGRLKDWAEKLPGSCFMQVHRSAIIRLTAVEGIRRAGSAWRARMPGGIEVPVSRSRGTRLRRRLGNG